ncbi:hypothetical protein SLS62_003036 [Diatrype stigma]|uniref:Glucose-methanol-choline oxidoreductase N-terminal domain-containing protein n=1 Tax=Diatrype stigma TaxID=117547 RepID=A0AAN9YUC8_9PEZI
MLDEINTFDYIIVGVTVLVVENGHVDNNSKTQIPRDVADFQNITEWWNVTSTPVEHLGSAIFNVNMASVVGGGSVVNGMAADRGSKADYDAWEALGNEGWGWDGLFPYFRRSTNFTPPLPDIADSFDIVWDPEDYGQGPLQIGFPSIQYPDLRNITAALGSHGILTSNKPASGDAFGLIWMPNTLDVQSGTRCHARVAYYDPVADRPNLHLATGEQVLEILFQSPGLIAIGVNMESREDGKLRKAYARKEVILAAGAISTPKLLQLSGIGPMKVIANAGVELKKDLPAVGANFQDHPSAYMTWNFSNLQFPNINLIYTNATYNESAWEEYVTNHIGPYTTATGNVAVFLPLSQLLPSSEVFIGKMKQQKAPDYLPSIYNDKNLLRGFEAQRDILINHFSSMDSAVAEFPIPPASPPTVVVIEKPLSRGTVTLDPLNPRGQPIVQYNTLMNPVDQELLLAMIRYLRDFNYDPLLAGYKPLEIVPGAAARTDEEVMTALVAAGRISPSFAHPSGTCAMMPAGMGGCVGSDLLVYGTKRLSVVDAPIMPLIPATHLQTTVYAVAEKASDIIKSRAS